MRSYWSAGMKSVVKQLLVEHIAVNGFCRVRAGGGCMAPAIRDGALVTIRPRSAERLRTGEIIAFFIGEKLFVHRLTVASDGQLWARGDNGESPLQHIEPGWILGAVEEVENPSLLRRALRKICRFGSRGL
jgi:hypothetical protein